MTLPNPSNAAGTNKIKWVMMPIANAGDADTPTARNAMVDKYSWAPTPPGVDNITPPKLTTPIVRIPIAPDPGTENAC
jgi:hypothetical protein